MLDELLDFELLEDELLFFELLDLELELLDLDELLFFGSITVPEIGLATGCKGALFLDPLDELRFLLELVT